jgi:tellurite resistance protein TehA-like permease
LQFSVILDYKREIDSPKAKGYWAVNFPFVIYRKMTENCKLGKAIIIIRILQHFATKLWNITNFVMLFQAVMKYLSRSKFSLLRKWSIDIEKAEIDIQTLN